MPKPHSAKFHEYRSLADVQQWKAPRQDQGRGLWRYASLDDFYKDMLRPCLQTMNNAQPGSAEQQSASTRMYWLKTEMEWWQRLRPYYKVWPAILEALTRLKLDVVAETLAIPNIRCLIRFHENNSLKAGGASVDSFLVGAFHDGEGDNSGPMCICMSSNIRGCDGNNNMWVWPPLRLMYGRTLEYFVNNEIIIKERHGPQLRPCRSSSLDQVFSSDDDRQRLFSLSLRVAFSVLLLAHDPSIVEPDVLSKDREKYQRTLDEKCVERAHRRGKVGWHIGRQLESMPHYRRPHFALRWTGKGGNIPRIVPVKGAVVHREKWQKVPTGYITPDGVEVEP